MKLFPFGAAARVDQCARELADEFSRLCPLAGSAQRHSEKSVQRALDRIYGRARDFRTEHRLGVFRRARLARAFQDELHRRGYPPDLVSKVTASLVATALTGR